MEGLGSCALGFPKAIADLALDFSDSDKKKKTMSRPFGVEDLARREEVEQTDPNIEGFLDTPCSEGMNRHFQSRTEF